MENSSSSATQDRYLVRATILSLLAKRGPGKTCCPSEVPRLLFSDKWRDYMDLTRSVAWELESELLLEICQKGQVMKKKDVKGPIRLRLKE